ncbi:hypothetical protein LJY25_13790 [Hymenobacter sp. BT175]|uniref:hypothetical protein n=1 Tax=Hymenobacter translucens TaxID=2886507 RepID=UPI001D0DF51C|nr:hypothetical protein [Hymenobacter translucens]MCC2547523.1 hypothetical protein [Hymenobacter translucens]
MLIAALTGLYLLLPTRNSSLDAWYYAACVRYGHELLLPHHLLFNVAGRLWLQLLQLTGLRPDALAAVQALNALAAGATLALLYCLLRRLGRGRPLAMAWVLVVGSSFGVMRFATEAETYILPLLLSLAASRCWVQYLLLPGRPAGLLFSAGLLASLACLLHQVHVFWWLGLLLGTVWLATAKAKALLTYALPALLVPLAYALALPSWNLPLTVDALWHFVFHDYYAGAGGGVSGRGLLLTGANVVRTFGQVHGSTLALVQRLPGLLAVPLIVVGLLMYAAWQVRRQSRGRQAEKRPASPLWGQICLVHALILVLHLLFAAYSDGNAEFMVMLPALLAVAASQLNLPARSVAVAGGALLLWNLAFGLVPARLLQFTNHTRLLSRIQQEPRAWFLLDNHNLVLNQLHYLTGNPAGPANVLPAPTLLVQRPDSTAEGFRQWLRAQRQAERVVYTNTLGAPRLLDRAQLVYGNQNAALLAGFRTARVDSFPTFFGPYYLTVIQ